MTVHLAYLSDAIIPSKGADSVQVMKTCDKLASSDLKVTLMSPKANGENDVYSYYDVKDNFKIIRIPFQPFERYQLSVLSGIKAMRLNPDVIYGRFIPSCFFAALTGKEVVIESHSPANDSGKIIGTMFSTLVKSGRIRDLVVISESLANYYAEHYPIDRKNIHVIPDAASDPLPVEPRINTSDFSVGYVGHLYEGKGMPIVAQLAKRLADIEFHIVGGSDSDINHWMTELNDRDNVYFHGFVPPAEVPSYQASFDVLIAPYGRTVYGSARVTDLSKWMSPLKLFEYMAVEKPILTSDLPVIREVMENEVNCLLCDPDDIEDWVTSLERLRDDEELRTQLSSTAREQFENEYTYEARAEKIVRALDL